MLGFAESRGVDMGASGAVTPGMDGAPPDESTYRYVKTQKVSCH